MAAPRTLPRVPASAAFALGLLVGLAVAAGLLWAVVRSVGRAVGADQRGVARLIVDGLRPGSSPDGVAAQRALARRLRRTGRRTASGRRVAASEVELHVGPEDFALIDEALGIERAVQDLTGFYRAHAADSGWLVQGEPRIALVRDISLRPRQAFARATIRAEDRAPVPARPPTSSADAAGTDVLRRAGHDEVTETITRSYPVEELGAIVPGDLVVVHGTDVRTVPASLGRLTVGRSAHNDLVIDRPTIARDHLVVERRGDGWWAVPGTTPNGTRLDGHLLDAPGRIDGQVLLELGRGVRVRVSVEPAPGAA